MPKDDQTVDQHVVDFVRLGQRVSRNFTVRMRNRATFDAVMAAARGATRSSRTRWRARSGRVFDDAMGVEFGAEGSAVLYIEVPFFPHQRYGSTQVGMSEPYSDEERRAFAQRVIDWAKRVRADEISTQQYPPEPTLRVWHEPGEHPYKIRIWWTDDRATKRHCGREHRTGNLGGLGEPDRLGVRFGQWPA
jgi:hypothetical protein